MNCDENCSVDNLFSIGQFNVNSEVTVRHFRIMQVLDRQRQIAVNNKLCQIRIKFDTELQFIFYIWVKQVWNRVIPRVLFFFIQSKVSLQLWLKVRKSIVCNVLDFEFTNLNCSLAIRNINKHCVFVRRFS